jgi:hypothetical protein
MKKLSLDAALKIFMAKNWTHTIFSLHSPSVARRERDRSIVKEEERPKGE